MIRREDKNGRRLSEGLVKWRQYEDSTTWTDVPKEYIKPVTSTVSFHVEKQSQYTMGKIQLFIQKLQGI